MISLETLIKLNYIDNLNRNDYIIIDNKVKIHSNKILTNIYKDIIINHSTLALEIINKEENELLKYYLLFLYYLSVNNKNETIRTLTSLISIDAKKYYKEETDLYSYIILNYQNDFNISPNNKYNILLKKYIKSGYNDLAISLISFLDDNKNSYWFLKKCLLNYKKSNIIYIINDELECKLINYLDLNKYNDFKELYKELKTRIELKDAIIYENITTLIDNLNIIQNNINIISDINLNSITGTPDNVIYELLMSFDLNRLNDVLEELVNQSECLNIKYYIYNYLVKEMLKYNKRNKSYKEYLVNNISSEEELYEFLNVNKFVSITDTILDKVSQNMSYNIDKHYNYYNEYEKCFINKDYKNALMALNNYKKQMQFLGIYCYVEDKIKLLNIMIENNYIPDDKKCCFDITYNHAYELEKKGKYLEAIEEYYKSLEYLSVNNPKILVRIAKCLTKLNETKRAIKMYRLASCQSLSEDEYMNYMILLYKTKDYDTIISKYLEVDKFNPKGNEKLYYLLSIAYINKGEFTRAKESIRICRDINERIADINYDYKEEEDIINRISKGEVISSYKFEDIIDFNLTFYDIKRYEMVDKKNIIGYIENLSCDINEKQEYLLSIIKNMYVNDEKYDYLLEYLEKITDEEYKKNKYLKVFK